jgi:hypothetical protein
MEWIGRAIMFCGRLSGPLAEPLLSPDLRAHLTHEADPMEYYSVLLVFHNFAGAKSRPEDYSQRRLSGFRPGQKC